MARHSHRTFARGWESKVAVPRHRTQARASSAAQERTIERRVRQAARAEIRRALSEAD